MNYTTIHWSIVIKMVDLRDINYFSEDNPSTINCQSLLFVFDFLDR